MSSIAQTAARRVATLQIPRTLAASAPRAAAFSTSFQFQKSAAETAKDALKTVDRAVSDKLVDGINMGCTFSPVLSHPYFPTLIHPVSSNSTY
jgi:hypothetical protein